MDDNISVNVEYFKKSVSVLRVVAIFIMFICLILGGNSGFNHSTRGQSYLAFGSLLLIMEVIHLIYFGLNINKLKLFSRLKYEEAIFTIIETLFLFAFIVIECVYIVDWAPELNRYGKALACFILGFIYTLFKLAIIFMAIRLEKNESQSEQ